MLSSLIIRILCFMDATPHKWSTRPTLQIRLLCPMVATSQNILKHQCQPVTPQPNSWNCSVAFRSSDIRTWKLESYIAL